MSGFGSFWWLYFQLFERHPPNLRSLLALCAPGHFVAGVLKFYFSVLESFWESACFFLPSSPWLMEERKVGEREGGEREREREGGREEERERWRKGRRKGGKKKEKRKLEREERRIKRGREKKEEERELTASNVIIRHVKPLSWSLWPSYMYTCCIYNKMIGGRDKQIEWQTDRGREGEEVMENIHH